MSTHHGISEFKCEQHATLVQPALSTVLTAATEHSKQTPPSELINQGSGWIEVPQASAASKDAVFQAAQDMRKQVDAHYNRMSEEYNRRAEAAASISGEGAKTAEPDQDLAAEAEYMCPRLKWKPNNLRSDSQKHALRAAGAATGTATEHSTLMQ